MPIGPVTPNREMHIHPWLQLTYNGRALNIPANIGIDPRLTNPAARQKYARYGSDMGAEPIHTHDASSAHGGWAKLHVESKVTTNWTLGDFFDIAGWDVRQLEQAGYNVKVTANGQPVQDYSNLVLTDGERVKMDITDWK